MSENSNSSNWTYAELHLAEPSRFASTAESARLPEHGGIVSLVNRVRSGEFPDQNIAFVNVLAADLPLWEFEWEQFQIEHSQWCARWNNRPAYSLPVEVVQYLARHSRRTLFTESDAQTEIAFSEFCRRSRIVGVWNGRRIQFDFFVPSSTLSDAEIREAGLSPSQVKHAVESAQGRWARLKGVIGWLVTDPKYLRQLNRLRCRWQALEPAVRPPFPLDRERSLRAPYARHDSRGRFLCVLNLFLDRWGLTHLATWDLPAPQGPLISNPLPSGAVANPHHGVHIYLPFHFPLLANDDLWREVCRFQTECARLLRIDVSAASLEHADFYAHMCDVAHLEGAIRARFPEGGLPRGSMQKVEQAMSDALDVSIDTIQKVRKAISSCRRGMRSAVPSLSTRLRRF